MNPTKVPVSTVCPAQLAPHDHVCAVRFPDGRCVNLTDHPTVLAVHTFTDQHITVVAYLDHDETGCRSKAEALPEDAEVTIIRRKSDLGQAS